MKPDDDDIPSERNLVKWVAGVVLLIGVAWCANWIVLSWLVGEPAKMGQFGDMFGAVNALFSGLALAGVVLAIILQKDELRLQRKELRDTRREMEKATIAQDASQRALNKQVELLVLTTRINALGACLNTYNALIDEHQKSTANSPFRFTPSDFEQRRRDGLTELESLMKQIQEEKCS